MRPLAAALCLLLAACAKAPPPENNDAAATSPPEATELRDAMQQPIDKAKAVDAVQEKAAEEQRKAVEDAGG